MFRTAVIRALSCLLLAFGVPHAALSATASVSVDLSTSVQASPIIMSGQPGCGLPPPPSMFGPGPESYSYGQTAFTTGAAAGDNVFEVTSDIAGHDPAILVYAGASGFDPADPAANLVGCDDNSGLFGPTLPRLVVSLPPGNTYTVVVLVPEVATSGSVTADLGLGLDPTASMLFPDHSVALGATGETMIADSDSLGAIQYASSDEAVAEITAGGAITAIAIGSTSITALQLAELNDGTYGPGRVDATLTVTASIDSATYDAGTGVMVVTASGLAAGDTISPSKLTITGQGGGSRTLSNADFTASSATGFSIPLNAGDKTAVDALLDKNGASSTDGITYNVAAAASWNASRASAADLTGNAITVSNVASPAACSSAYTQTGYDVSNCPANTPSGTSCSAICAAGYAGPVSGTVSCSAGSYTGSFSGCSVFSRYYVRYDGNGATGGTAPTDATGYAAGSSVTVLGSGSLAKTGYSFAGWNTSPGGTGIAHTAGSSFTISADTTLFAQWAPAACASAYTQTGYHVFGCPANTTSGTVCSAVCASGYYGTARGDVSCSAGSYTGSFSGCTAHATVRFTKVPGSIQIAGRSFDLEPVVMVEGAVKDASGKFGNVELWGQTTSGTIIPLDSCAAREPIDGMAAFIGCRLDHPLHEIKFKLRARYVDGGQFAESDNEITVKSADELSIEQKAAHLVTFVKNITLAVAQPLALDPDQLVSALRQKVAAAAAASSAMAGLANTLSVTASSFRKTKSLTDAQYVELLYRILLDRAPDPGGLAYWNSLIASGSSRDAVLTGFVRSREFAESMTALFDAGTPRSDASFVAVLYRALLERPADEAGFAFHLRALREAHCRGLGRLQAAATASYFLDSAEYRSLGKSNGAFIDDLYDAVLGRMPDAGGRAFWVARLDGGAARAAVVHDFMNSVEFAAEVARSIAQESCQPD